MKFKSNSKNFLFEAFSPSMPKWLQNYIMYNPLGFIKGWYGGKSFSKTADPQFDKFKNARHRDTGRERGNIGISVIKDQGLDFSRAKFFSQDVPQKIDDPIFLDTNKMCFVHLKSDNDETVWIPNFSNKKERFIKDDGKPLTLEYINNKLLKTYGKDFCYIDLTDKNNFNQDLKQNREDSKKDLVTRDKNNAGHSSYYAKWDKSGYRVIPSVERYADKLRELKIKKIPEKLIQARENLVNFQKNFQQIQTEYVMSNATDGALTRALNQANNDFLNSINYLKNTIEQTEQLNKVTNEYDKKYVTRRITQALNDCEAYLKSAQSRLSPYLPSELDWDENDDSIYVDVEDDFE